MVQAAVDRVVVDQEDSVPSNDCPLVLKRANRLADDSRLRSEDLTHALSLFRN